MDRSEDEEHRRFFSRVEELDAVLARHGSPHDIVRCLKGIVQEGLVIKQMLLDHFQLEDAKYQDYLRRTPSAAKPG
jgi:hypothetical protein